MAGLIPDRLKPPNSSRTKKEETRHHRTHLPLPYSQ
jgi:hypothetical protein